MDLTHDIAKVLTRKRQRLVSSGVLECVGVTLNCFKRGFACGNCYLPSSEEVVSHAC